MKAARTIGMAGAVFACGLVCGWWWSSTFTGNQSRDQNPSSIAPAANGSTPSAPAELPNETSETKDFFSRVHMALSLRSSDKRARALSTITDGLDAAQIQDALARLQNSRISNRDEIIVQLFARWGGIDPQAAMESARGLSKTSESRQAMLAVLGGWVGKDAGAAERWVAELPDGLLKNSARESLIGAIAINDPKHACTLARDLSPSWPASQKLAESIFLEWAGTNPREAAAHAAELPPGGLRNSALRVVANTWAEMNVAEALAWAESEPDPDLEIRPVGSVGPSLLTAVLQTWVKKDSQAVARWLEQLPDGEKKAALSSNACTFLMSAPPNPQVTMDLAMMLPEGAQRDAALQQSAQQIAWWDPAAGLACVRQQSDPHVRKTILSGLISHLSGDDLRSALHFAEGLPGHGKEDVISIERDGGTRSWRLTDPATLAAWAVKQPNNQESLSRIATAWAEEDPESAAEWLRSLSGPAKDKALQRIFDRSVARIPGNSAYLTATHFQTTERWVSMMNDQQARQSAYEKLARTWLDMDAESARAWLSASPLPRDLKERVLNSAAAQQ
ncbi:MAG: hypothetical protein M3463_03845 [Verrucomicrobiota bacterium]|nr:hypothetical protein [Verrucomicrobiota bacterium]